MPGEKLRKVVQDYVALLASQEGKGLLKDQQQRLDLLRDVLVENGVTLDSQGWPQAAAARDSREPLGPHPLVCLLITDPAVARPTWAVLELSGHRVTDSFTQDPAPMLIVADTDRVVTAAQRYPGTPLVLVNVSGPDALMGKLSALQPAAFVKRPATIGSVVEAIQSVEARLGWLGRTT